MPDAATLTEWAVASQALLFVTKSPGDTLEAGKINLLDTSGGPGTFTLPDPSLTRDPVVAKRTGTGDATINVFGGGTIDGALTNVLTVDQEAATYSALDPNYRGTAGLGTPSTPLAHAPSHESGGSDEISVAALVGLLADPQTPLAHASTHESGGSDEIGVAALVGLLADPQTPLAHASTHESGGSDEIGVAALVGLLADPQTPLAHATSHESGGSDELDVTALGGFPGGTTDFLRADGAFAVPPGGGGGGSSFLLFGAGDVGSSITEKFLFPSYADASAQASPILIQIPAGVADINAVRMIIRQNNPQGNGDDIVYTLHVNGVDSALAVTLASTGTSANASATVLLQAGDRIVISVTKATNVNNSPDDITCLLEIEPA